jgi:hypothetical protein
VRPATIITVVAIALAGCGGDDDAKPTHDPRLDDAAVVYAEIRDLTNKQQIERVGAAWADAFSRGYEAMCEYLHPDVAGGCSEYLESTSARLRRSYAETSVTGVEINGRSAVASFSNGERVDFEQDPRDRWMVVGTSRAR